MKWYLAKLIYRIICGEGTHTPQFDEQLRLINAEDDFMAYQKAKATGLLEEDIFFNNKQKMVNWKFIDVSEIHVIDEFIDGAELYSRIFEHEEADNFIKLTHWRSEQLEASCNEKQLIIN